MTGSLLDGVIIVDLAHSFGGVERRVFDTARGLSERGYTVEVVCLAGSPVAAALNEARVTTRPLAHKKWDPRLVLRLRRLLRQRQGWVVDAHNAQSQLVVHLAYLGRGPGLRTIATIHSDYRVSEMPRWGFAWHVAALAWTIRVGWELLSVSSSVTQSLIAMHAPADRIRLVHSGVPEPTQGRARLEIRRDLGFGEDDFVIAAVGRLVPVKNIGLAVRALGLLRHRLPRPRLMIVGEGPERRELERLAVDVGAVDDVTFLGHRDDVAELLGSSDVMVITSLTEGLPYVLLEAAAAGVPVVSTRVGAIPEAFDNDSLVLLPPASERSPDGAEALAAAIMALAHDWRRAADLARQAKSKQRQDFSLASMIASTLNIYSTEFVDQSGSFCATRGGPCDHG